MHNCVVFALPICTSSSCSFSAFCHSRNRSIIPRYFSIWACSEA